MGIEPKASVPSSLWGPLTPQVGTGGDRVPGTSELLYRGSCLANKGGQGVCASPPSRPRPPWSRSQEKWRRGRLRHQHLTPTTSRRRPPVLLLLLNSRDSDPFLTETHECLLGQELPQDQVGPPGHRAALATVGPPRTPISKPTPQPGLCGQRMGHGAPPLAGTPLGPAALPYHL